MGIWDWFKRKRAASINPESRWVVGLNEDGVEVTPPNQPTQQVLLSELLGVAVETNDTGPLGAEVWWLLFGKDDTLACAFPQGATGEQAVIDALTTLPGFDHEAMIRAMSSTDNATFPLWRSPHA